MVKNLRGKLRERLRDPEYRHAYADETLNSILASQIRVLREERDLSQAQLAEEIGTKQSGISRLENADYDGWSIRTLKKIAEALDVRLRISFEPFGTLWWDISTCDREHLRRPSFDRDPEFIQVIGVRDGLVATGRNACKTLSFPVQRESASSAPLATSKPEGLVRPIEPKETSRYAAIG